jgi:EAL domain-containing protein (putative c-di-GMP-specific phosphodiesterase class I)
MNNCALCSLHKQDESTEIYLYAATPILQQIITSRLQELGAEFQLERDLFTISGKYNAILRELVTQLSEAERADVRVSRRPGAALLSASTLDSFQQHLDTEWFEEALRSDSFTSFFQPIVDIRNASLFGHECLIRLFGERAYNGSDIMAAAVSRGAIHVFDSYARRLSIRKAAAQFTPGTKVFINFMPSSIYDPLSCMASTRQAMQHTNLRAEDIVFEVVESDKVRDVKHLQRICDYYRNSGFGFALDDFGTGSNSIQLVCDLKPDYIKLDKSWICRLSEPMIQTATQKMAEFAEQSNVKVIAEGIEEAESAERLRQMGIHLMQGYYFGKPNARMKSTTSDLSALVGQLGRTVVPQTPLSTLVS